VGHRSVFGFANEACNLYSGKVIRKHIYPCSYGAARGEKFVEASVTPAFKVEMDGPVS